MCHKYNETYVLYLCQNDNDTKQMSVTAATSFLRQGSLLVQNLRHTSIIPLPCNDAIETLLKRMKPI